MSDALLRHTEAAMALLEGSVADIVYLPPDVRKSRVRIDGRGVRTERPPSEGEQIDRITMADPLGFLVAVMNGQPVLTFGFEPKIVAPNKKRASKKTVKRFPMIGLEDADGGELVAYMHTPTMAERVEIAKFLVPFVTEKRAKKAKPDPDQPEAPADEAEARLQERLNSLGK